MYTRIGSFDAKTNLSALLRAVRRGQRYTVTLRGQPVADLVPSKSAARADARAAVEAMQQMPKVKGVSGETLTAWIAEGRR
jgi:prevent-host-death family protein